MFENLNVLPAAWSKNEIHTIQPQDYSKMDTNNSDSDVDLISIITLSCLIRVYY